MMRATLPPIFTRCADMMRLTGLAGTMVLALCGFAWAQAAGDAKPKPPASAVGTDDGQWTMAEKNYAATRFSTLDQINGTNVKGLQVAFTFSTGTTHGEEAAPLVVDNTMYIVTPYPNILYALDLTKPGAPMKWEYKPKPVPASQGVACCDVVNRGAAYYDGKIFYNTLDGQTVAVDAKDGHQVWKKQLGDINKGESITMAPLVVKGKVLVGNSGGEFGVRGWVQALDAGTGDVVWKAYSTGPDKDVLIGPDFHPFYAAEKGKDLGVSSWPPDAWKIGGGTMWGWIAYDPDLNLIYYGTANPGPWNQEQRPGDNKWTAGVFARDPDTGAAKWFYQTNPHDEHDYDGINEIVLLDMPVNGQVRKVLLHPDRDGYLDVLDRQTGELLAADPYATVNSILKIDMKTGRPVMNPAKETRLGSVVQDICPTASGGKDWITIKDYEQVEGLWLPRVLRLENHQQGWEAVFRFSHWQINHPHSTQQAFETLNEPFPMLHNAHP